MSNADVLKKRAQEMRDCMTYSEGRVWDRIRNGFAGGKWDAQKPLWGRYIADFYCKQLRTVIEVDGAVHFNDAAEMRDGFRTDFLWRKKIQVLRLTNDEAETALDAALLRIEGQIAFWRDTYLGAAAA